MSLTVHTTIGAIIGLSTANPILGFFAGLISHFVGDVIPHGDEILGEWYEQKEYRKLMPALLVDVTLTALFLFILFSFWQPTHLLVVSLAIFGSVLPDLWLPLYKTTRWKTLLPLINFHELNHGLLGHNWHITLREGAVVQTLFWLLLWGQIPHLLA